MMSNTQENRAMKIETPLGKDVLLITGMDGLEGISIPFRYDLELISRQSDIEFDKIIGKSVNISIVLASGDCRTINGIVTFFEKVDAGLGNTSGVTVYPYRATITPSFWLLDFTGDCKIFQNITVPKIVEGIFNEHKVQFKNNLNDDYSQREYCVQYNESDFTFVSRLLEEEGIFYYFEHEANKHTIVLADASSSFKPCPGQGEAKYRLSMEGKETEDMITSFNYRQKIGPTKYAAADFNFKSPSFNMEAKSKALPQYHPNELEIFCYPGNSSTIKESMRRSQIRAQEEECHTARITGSSNCRAFASGRRFTLKQFYRDVMNGKDYYLVAVTHSASQSVEDGASFHYSNSYSCLPVEVKYRPIRTTHKPVMQGSQTATVTGPKGEEIYVDNHGRVKVQFHWDRYGQKDENTSCWIRVSYPSSSSGFGFQTHPRIGDEVIVDFLEGDPDRPIVTGAVYNGSNPCTYKLPDRKTVSVLRTNSTPGGGGYNEIRFEDKKGSEEVYFQAEKDWNLLTKNNKGQTVGNNETLTVVNNRTKSVGVDQTVTIGSNHTESIGSNKTENIGSNKTITIGNCKTETVAINTAETIGAAKELTIGGLYQVSVGGAMNETIGAAKAEEIGAVKSVNVGLNSSENIGVNKSVDAGGNITQNAGKNMVLTASDNYNVKAGKNGVIDIGDQLVIKCGSASITMSKNGDITIEGKNINVKGSGNIVMKAKKITQN